jgi:four helix bundle protein
MEYSLRIVRLFRHLQRQKDGASWVLGRQLLRSATSVGANIAEAQAGESRADFIHKYSIAQKEARESLYWLKVLLKSESLPALQLQPLLDETNELIAIVTRIILNAKRATD